MLVLALSVLNGWGIYRPQPSSNLELKTINSRNFEIKRLHLLTGVVAPPVRARRLSLWVVPPPVRGVCTSCQSSKTELKRCHLLSGEVAPPSLAQRLSPRRCHRLAGAVAPPSLARRLSPGGATSCLGRFNRLAEIKVRTG